MTIVFGSKNSNWSWKQDVLSCHVFAKRESILRLQRTVSSLYRTIEGLVSVSPCLRVSISPSLRVSNSPFLRFHFSPSRQFYFSTILLFQKSKIPLVEFSTFPPEYNNVSLQFCTFVFLHKYNNTFLYCCIFALLYFCISTEIHPFGEEIPVINSPSSKIF